MPIFRNGPRKRPRGLRAVLDEAAGPGVDADLIRALAQLVGDSDLAELEVEKGDLRIKLVRRGVPHAGTAPTPVAAAPVAATPVVASATHQPGDVHTTFTTVPRNAVTEDHPGAVKSPMVGTVYLRPNPEAKAFVELGTVVRSGDRILLVEAMKTFNDIVAPRSGVISAIFVEDGQPVEYGQPLVVIE